MTDTEIVIRELEIANPVPDPSALHRLRPAVEEMLAAAKGSGEQLRLARPATSINSGWMVAVASFVVVLGLGAAFVWMMSPSTTEPADRIDQIERDAVAAAEQWLDATNRGDVARVMALSSPTSRDVSDQRMYEWLAGLAENGMPVEVDACVAVNATEQAASVECRVRLGDLVAVELGLSELTAPFLFSDGFVAWQPYRGGDISQVNRAYSNYLSQYHRDEYEAACFISAYERGSVVFDGGLALTGECAELAAPLADEVVQWIRDGRPAP